MIIIKKVRTKSDGRKFTEFPNRLYKGVKPYVPALSLDERNVFNQKTNPMFEYCDAIRFLAYDGYNLVGRIAGIINHDWNKANNIKTARFSRIDMVDDIEVTRALINEVSEWAKGHSLDTLIGPIGFTDFDRQGMLVDGFDQLNMFITIYNHKYYHEHLEQLGFVKDVDWIEKKITWPKELSDKIRRGSMIAKKRYGYQLIKCKTKKDVFKYIYDAFDMYNIAFNDLYGFFPITNKVMDYYIKQMVSFVDLRFLWFVIDKESKVVAFNVIMPSLAAANKKSNGKLLPFGWFRLLRSLKKSTIIDFYFVAVHPKHQGHGIIAMMFEDALPIGIKLGVTHAETGPELELNASIQNQWKNFESISHKRRRCYTKSL